MKDEILLAYVDGELSAAERAEVEAALAADPALAERVARERALKAMLSRAYDPVLDDPVPERLSAAAAPRANPGANVVDFSAARNARPRWTIREWGAMAASLAGGLILGFGMLNATNSDIVVASGDGMHARGALAQALERQLASDGVQGDIAIGLTFRARDGFYCRTFSAHDTAGLACRDDTAWRIETATHHERASGDIRMAASDTPPSVLAAASAIIEGETLDAETERSARDSGWR